MESTMTFQPGTYYVGDVIFVLPNDDLRLLLMQVMDGKFTSGTRLLSRFDNMYWLAVMPHRSGTLYDQNNNGWGFEWGGFGVVPWECRQIHGDYESNKVEFTEPFTCSYTDDSITIGHLHFTFEPK